MSAADCCLSDINRFITAGLFVYFNSIFVCVCVCVCRRVCALAVQQADSLSDGLDEYLSLAYLTHCIPVRALQIKIAAQLGHNVQSLALIRTLCACVCVCVCVCVYSVFKNNYLRLGT